jgi:hypothetical protein
MFLVLYEQNRKIGKLNNLKVLGVTQPMGLNKIAKIGYGHVLPEGGKI